jgi:hypothetical protein
MLTLIINEGTDVPVYCVFEYEPAEPETGIDPPWPAQMNLCGAYVNNTITADIMQHLTEKQRLDIEAEALDVLI